MGRKRKGRAISGWLLVDKPAGVTSTAVVNKVRWALQAQKAGHAGRRKRQAMRARWTRQQPGCWRSLWARPRKPCLTLPTR